MLATRTLLNGWDAVNTNVAVSDAAALSPAHISSSGTWQSHLLLVIP